MKLTAISNYYSATLPNYPPGHSLPKIEIRLTVGQISEAVCFYFGLVPADLQRRGRQQPYLKARQIFRFLRADEGESIYAIAKSCGIDYHTAHESINIVRGYLKVSDPYIADLWAIKGILTGTAVPSENALPLHRRAARRTDQRRA